MAADLLAPGYRSRTLVFFALGGGGVRTLEALLHLCALGLGPARLRVLVVDPDQANPSVGRAVAALEQYRETRDALAGAAGADGFFRTVVELVSPDVPVWSPLADDALLPDTRFSASVDRALMKDAPGLTTLHELLYPARVREMDLAAGFRGVPAVGAVFMNRLTSEPFFGNLLAEHRLDGGASLFFAAGSLFGGTGAAALPAVAAALRQRRSTGAPGAARESLGAALLLPYFTVPAGPGPEGAPSFVRNAAGVLPAFTDPHREPGYGGYYLLGDGLAREQEAYEPGGPAQSNPAHYVELFAALAALDFASRGGEGGAFTRLPVYRLLHVAGEDPGWGDLPVTPASRAALRSALVAMHVFLSLFRPEGRGGVELRGRLKGITWAEVLGVGSERWVGDAPLLDAVGRFWTRTWAWLCEMRASTPSLRLVAEPAGPPAAVPLHALLDPGQGSRGADVYALFRHWNVEAARRRGGGVPALVEVMRAGSERFVRDRLGGPASAGEG